MGRVARPRSGTGPGPGSAVPRPSWPRSGRTPPTRSATGRTTRCGSVEGSCDPRILARQPRTDTYRGRGRDGVAHGDRTRLIHGCVDAERHLARRHQRPERRDLLQRVPVALAGRGVLCRHRAPRHLTLDPQDCIADADATAIPCVLLERRRVVELEVDTEPKRVKVAVVATAASKLCDGRERHHRQRHLVGTVAVTLGPDQTDVNADVVGERLGDLPADGPAGNGAPVEVGLFELAEIVGGPTDNATAGEPASQRAVLDLAGHLDERTVREAAVQPPTIVRQMEAPVARDPRRSEFSTAQMLQCSPFYGRDVDPGQGCHGLRIIRKSDRPERPSRPMIVVALPPQRSHAGGAGEEGDRRWHHEAMTGTARTTPSCRT